MGIAVFSCCWVFILIISSLEATYCYAATAKAKPKCTPSSCGNIHNISHPFRLKHDPSHCGESRFTLSCEHNKTILNLHSSGKFYVQAINYNNQTIRAVDPGVDKHNCSSIPRNSLGSNMFIFPYNIYGMAKGTGPLTFLKCSTPLKLNYTRSRISGYVDASPCFPPVNAASSSSSQSYGYVKSGYMNVGELKDGCTIERTSYAYMFEKYSESYKSIHDSLVYGFELDYDGRDMPFFCGGQWSYNYICYPHTISGFFRFVWVLIQAFFASGILYVRFRTHYLDLRQVSLIFLGLFLVARSVVGAPFVIAFIIRQWKRRHLSMYNTIEDFLDGDHNFGPIRYSYSDIKKMSNKFKEKLGEGGYGSVFKGKLRSGRFGAIKMLDKPKGNGQDFINEVATIGRIHHVNVVQLVGYVVEGSKWALLYDFMPNGSLDKYIYSEKLGSNIRLSCEKMYEIALGVARGIAYLHQGCEMQILHFDIKPHNILLDENFIPKISDFGLAKLYPIDNSIVSLTAARGTMGYMAPELFYKNIGGVSYKADVYSFGMLLMEMTSRRKNLNPLAEHSSQLYFPSWVYDQYYEGNELELEMEEVTEEEKQIVKKMIITALWCIQMKPSDRPSMKKVIVMLEGGVELLQMPPKPSLCPQERPLGDVIVEDNNVNLNPVCSTELTSTLSGR